MLSSHPIPGSQRIPLPGATRGSAIDSDAMLDVTVVLRRAHPEKTVAALAKRERVTRQAFAKLHGANIADLEAVEDFARRQGLQIVHTSQRMRKVILRGTAAQLCAAFAVELHHFATTTVAYRGRQGPVFVPDTLAGIVEAVLGLDDRAQAHTHFRIFEGDRTAAALADVARTRAVAHAYTPVEVANLYNFPTSGASGQTIAIIELGGGFKPSDLSTYFAGLGVTEPVVTAVLVDGASNHPTNSNGADGEVLLDIEVAASVAPGAHVAVYFTPNTDAGFLDGVLEAIHDSTHQPSVLSISWGSAESAWTTQAMKAMDAAFQDAALLGITVCVASGDGGSSDGVSDGGVHVDFPASSPHALACGGTRLEGTGGQRTSESVWNSGADGGASGGGVSTVFAKPSWQLHAAVPPASTTSGGRGVPDVAGDADPATGYSVLVDGERLVIGGTSAVAPLWAGLIALFNAQLTHPVGLLQPALYALNDAKALNDITTGNNGAFTAGPGWDPCTGLGSPNGAILLAALTKATPSDSRSRGSD